jgi:hypothetical protein
VLLWRFVAEAVDAVGVGVLPAFAELDAVADGVDDAVGDGGSPSDGVGDADVGWADVEPLVDGVAGAALFDAVGTLPRTS